QSDVRPGHGDWRLAGLVGLARRLAPSLAVVRRVQRDVEVRQGRSRCLVRDVVDRGAVEDEREQFDLEGVAEGHGRVPPPVTPGSWGGWGPARWGVGGQCSGLA